MTLSRASDANSSVSVRPIGPLFLAHDSAAIPNIAEKITGNNDVMVLCSIKNKDSDVAL